MATSRRRGASILLAVAASLAAGSLLAACGDDGEPEVQVELSAAGERGKAVAQEQGCTSCHTADGGRSTGPTWQGLAGSEVALEGGETVVADDEHLRRAILAPRAEVVEGYPNIMPVYEGELSDEELDDLIAYLNDLSAG